MSTDFKDYLARIQDVAESHRYHTVGIPIEDDEEIERTIADFLGHELSSLSPDNMRDMKLAFLQGYRDYNEILSRKLIDCIVEKPILGLSLAMRAGFDPRTWKIKGMNALVFLFKGIWDRHVGDATLATITLLFVRAGADVNAHSGGDCMRTPLHYAVIEQKPLTCRVLLALGANPEVGDGVRKTPLDHANEELAPCLEIKAVIQSAIDHAAAERLRIATELHETPWRKFCKEAYHGLFDKIFQGKFPRDFKPVLKSEQGLIDFILRLRKDQRHTSHLIRNYGIGCQRESCAQIAIGGGSTYGGSHPGNDVTKTTINHGINQVIKWLRYPKVLERLLNDVFGPI